ncbi:MULTISPECIES: DNA-3-methyladenine glycosylase [Tissierellales]|jgi:DNA-3-methyladenine glycosylase|uniref:Putative 3-methyladenine DNA glycosylase n=1 Tax=Acidilutibacter cellobiosedens TaxID=2507161 RepID=A0A410QGJ8_9FIRM|nr:MULTISPECIES: DNA-3-methyladenine glycosylase [Tissierellales]QAT63127.1 DNA-3-methyladenine glycosylase [Acidilutibacter cellobiosedens]SCL86115.1 3-methyladenine DNA glycosylase [Sporanaerobacter sp. PP17-6a]
MKLNDNFYLENTETVARKLLGKILVHNINGNILKGKIVETEAYMGVTDKGAHSYGGRRTKRVEIMYGPPGRAYIYFIYGMYYCLNAVTQKEGIPEAVLIRALEPLEGHDIMALNRFNKEYKDLTSTQITNLTNGPGKLCMAMGIDKKLNGNMLSGDTFYIEEGNNDKFDIIKTKRIGIDYAEEAKDFLLRFYIKGSPFVSKKG